MARAKMRVALYILIELGFYAFRRPKDLYIVRTIVFRVSQFQIGML